MRIAVLGVGLIGGSIGMAARSEDDGTEVAGWDVDPSVLSEAKRRGALDLAARSPEDALEGASACFVCAPVGVLPDVVARALAAAPEDCVVSDVGSTKRALVGSVDDPRFVGGHPIAGSENAGVQHARPDMFVGAAWYLTPLERSSGLLYERLHRLVVSFGASPIAIEADTHDRLLATVSHLPHVLANLLVSQAARALDEEGEALPRVGPSFRDATRVAGANPAIWTDIYMSNREAIAAELEATAGRLAEVAGALRAGDDGAIAEWSEGAREDRRRLLENELAGGELHELRITVPNRPGIVAQVALALGKAGVNIADMALSPAPDMRSGAMTLWVAGDGAAARAAELIEELGFPVADVI
jgi:prephenate dehydrogenase